MLRRMATLAQSRLAALARAVRERYRDDEVGTHAAALAYQLFLSTLALSLVGLALMGLAEDVLPFDLPEGTEEQFANLTGGASATLGIVSFVVLLDGLGARPSREAMRFAPCSARAGRAPSAAASAPWRPRSASSW